MQVEHILVGKPHPEALNTMAQREVIPIDKHWQFKQAEVADSKFLPVAQFPTNLHLDLIGNNIIPDPFIGKNELDVQWVGEAAWAYQTTFHVPDLSAVE